jgi:general secretion pathway protein A
LRCRTTRGGLDELRQLNRPAVLHMRDNQGQEFYATLTQLDDKSATFTVGNATRAVALGGLAAQWSGHYTLLWRMPPVARKNIRLGERGPDVEWLSKQLAQVHGKATETTGDPVFDDAMVSQVKQFQLVQGLTPDGAVGSQTRMRLSAAADRTAPKLSREQAEKGK